MASNFKKSETILIPFLDGWSISDSQGKPRMYKTREAFEKSFPRYYLGTDGVELEEYALVHHGRWIRQDDTFTRYMCSECESKNHDGHEKYCPACGAKMDLEEK